MRTSSPNRARAVRAAFAFVLFAALLTSCERKTARFFVIWTDNPSFVLCTELFNLEHPDTAALVVYKENLAASFPPGADETPPNLVIGSYLKDSHTRLRFSPLDDLFEQGKLDEAAFYPSLLEYGKMSGKRYLIPVSFNLGMVVFPAAAEDAMPHSAAFTLDELKSAASSYNAQSESGEYTRMGFAPSWDEDFLYLVTRLKGAAYRQKGDGFLWDAEALDGAVSYLRDWSTSCNSGTRAESDFKFKYLYREDPLRVTEGHALFSYTVSSEYFAQDPSLTSQLSFRWLSDNSTVCAEDDMTCLALYRGARNRRGAEEFALWLFRADTQSRILERVNTMQVDTRSFGVAGGFSSLRSVNEDAFPAYYRGLLSAQPPADSLSFANLLPPRWRALRHDVIIPYLKEATDTDAAGATATLAERLSRAAGGVYPEHD